jgi:hypothetical protein
VFSIFLTGDGPNTWRRPKLQTHKITSKPKTHLTNPKDPLRGPSDSSTCGPAPMSDAASPSKARRNLKSRKPSSSAGVGPRPRTQGCGGAHGFVAAAPPPLLPMASSPATARLLLRRPRRRGRGRRRRRLEAERRRGLRRRAGRQCPPPPLRRPPLLTGAVPCFRLDFHSVPLLSHREPEREHEQRSDSLCFVCCCLELLDSLLIRWRIIVLDQID